MEQEYAKIKVTFPPKSYQEASPMFAFSKAIRIEIDGKPLLCRDINFNSDNGELALRVSPRCFEIAVEPDSADELINEIESVMKVTGEKDESSKV